MEDDLGTAVPVPTDVRRVVSLVPSLTEALHVSRPGLVVGATAWCTHPADLDVPRVGGTKNPDVAAVLALRPDLVVTNEEENRAVDVQALREAGTGVWVTRIRTVDESLESLRRLLHVCGIDTSPWLDAAEAAWIDPAPVAAQRLRAVVPIWRRPWMALGRDTFAGDVLARLGVDNVLADYPERYPRFAPDALPAHDLVVLPDEPYAFDGSDGPESFSGKPCALVSGRDLTWYGPSMVGAAERLARSIAGSPGVNQSG